MSVYDVLGLGLLIGALAEVADLAFKRKHKKQRSKGAWRQG